MQILSFTGHKNPVNQSISSYSIQFLFLVVEKTTCKPVEVDDNDLDFGFKKRFFRISVK